MPYRAPTPNPTWFNNVQVGSVLRERSGMYRIVRRVSRSRSGDLRSVTLVIRRRSWTGRAYTVLTYSDLKARGFSMVPNVRVKIPRSLLDVRIAQAIEQDSKEPYIITADEVAGIP